jgi:hypothetical protein
MKTKLIAALFFTVLLMNACAPATTPAPTPDVNAIYTSQLRRFRPQRRPRWNHRRLPLHLRLSLPQMNLVRP